MTRGKVSVRLNPDLWQISSHTDGGLQLAAGEVVEISTDEFERVSAHRTRRGEEEFQTVVLAGELPAKALDSTGIAEVDEKA